MISVYKRELKSYFTSVIVWVFFAVFAVFSGLFSAIYNFYGGYSRYELSLTYMVIIMLISVPILTMKVLSDEHRSKTDLLLSSLPISTSDYVVGKYLALLTINAMTFAFTAIMPLVLSLYSQGGINYKSAYASVISFFLCNCALFAIGLFISSITENAVVAALISIGSMFAIYFMPIITEILPQGALTNLIGLSVLLLLVCLIIYLIVRDLTLTGTIAIVGEAALISVFIVRKEWLQGLLSKIFSSISVTERFESIISSSVFDLTSVIYFISVSILFVFFAVVSEDRRRFM